jgi:hypothetical protein
MKKYEFKKGTYFIGDSCYAISGDIWDKFCDKLWKEQDKDNNVFEFMGHKVFAGNTKYGDGCFNDEDFKHYFSVDAGLIGLTPIELVTKYNMKEINELGLIKTFEKDFIVQYEDGYFVFDDITIDTGDEDYKEEEEE